MVVIRVVATTNLDLYSFVLSVSREYVILMWWYIVDIKIYCRVFVLFLVQLLLNWRINLSR